MKLKPLLLITAVLASSGAWAGSIHDLGCYKLTYGIEFASNYYMTAYHGKISVEIADQNVADALYENYSKYALSTIGINSFRDFAAASLIFKEDILSGKITVSQYNHAIETIHARCLKSPESRSNYYTFHDYSKDHDQATPPVQPSHKPLSCPDALLMGLRCK